MNTMTETARQMRIKWAAGDMVRDAGLTYPEDVVRCTDLQYGSFPENTLDVYYPEGTSAPLPTIVSVHGGGWFYGSKELYSHYCTRLARRGFTVVNFDYRLAPEHQYPAPLEDTFNLMRWMQDHAEEYCIDLNNVFLVGDSAGGQIGFQVLTMLTNPKYAALCQIPVPEDFKVRACALNCGAYFIPPFNRFLTPEKASIMFKFYFPEDYAPIVPQLKTHKYITRDFPPAFIMTAAHDYLKIMAKPLHLLMKMKGAKSQYHFFGTKEDMEMKHVFHLNCRLPEADRCNDMQCEFFRSHMV